MDYADLHRLVDQVPRHSLHLVARLVEAVLSEEDPVARALDEAPEDDELLTAEDHEALMEGLKDLNEERTSAHEEVLRQAALWDAEEAGR